MKDTAAPGPRLAAKAEHQELPEGFAHRFVPVGQRHLHAVQGGGEDLPALVLLGGYPEDWREWAEILPGLAESHHVLALDIPAQGLSDPAPGLPTTPALAQMVHEAVAALLPGRRYALVAHDVGAWVAFAYAFLHEDELTALVLLDAGIPGVSLPTAVPLDPELLVKTWHFAFRQVADLPEVLLAGREREYVTWFFRNKTHDPDAISPAAVDGYVEALLDQGGMGHGLGYYRAIPESARRHREMAADRALRVPVLGVSGEFGSIPDMAATLRAFATDVSGVVIPGAGHFIPEEQPAALAAALDGFLDGLDLDRPPVA